MFPWKGRSLTFVRDDIFKVVHIALPRIIAMIPFPLIPTSLLFKGLAFDSKSLFELLLRVQDVINDHLLVFSGNIVEGDDAFVGVLPHHVGFAGGLFESDEAPLDALDELIAELERENHVFSLFEILARFDDAATRRQVGYHAAHFEIARCQVAVYEFAGKKNLEFTRNACFGSNERAFARSLDLELERNKGVLENIGKGSQFLG